MWTLLLADASQVELRSIVLVLAASSTAAIVSRLHSRLVVPAVVLEVLLGILIGPEVLDIAPLNQYLVFLSDVGLAFLFFFAGLEVVEQHVPRSSLQRGTGGWLISVVIGLAAGYALHAAGVDGEGWLLGIAVATTALGTLVPILSDARLLPTDLGAAVLGTGVAGEFWPIVVISIFLTGVYGAATEVILLIAFGGVVALAAGITLRTRPPRLLRVLQETVHTTGQAAVRLLASLILLTRAVGFDYVLGAFAAGLVTGLALDSPEGKEVQIRLEGIGFGFVIPIYFVVTGMTFDVDGLLTPSGLGLSLLFLALMFVVRGASAVLWLRELGARETASLAFFGATQLVLVVAVVTIGTGRHAISSTVGAALIGAGMITVLLFPIVGTRITASKEAVEAEHLRPAREF